jgi:hypothetical protein
MRIRHFKWIRTGSSPDPGFWWPKNKEKNTAENSFFCFWSKIAIYFCPSYRRSLLPFKKNIQRFKIMKFLSFSLCLWVIFALLNPDTDPGHLLNQDPIRIHSTADRYLPFGMNYDWSRRAYLYLCCECTTGIHCSFLPVWQLTINISWRHKIGHSRSSLIQGYFIVTTFKILRRKCSVNSLSLVEGYLQQYTRVLKLEHPYSMTHPCRSIKVIANFTKNIWHGPWYILTKFR